MTLTKKPGRPKDEQLQARREEEILDAAAVLFAKSGYADTDVQILADQLQVGKGTIYRYFPSKRELFLATVDRGMQQLHAVVEARVAQVEDGLERIVMAITAYLQFFSEQPELVELFVQERAHFKDRSQPAYFAAKQAKSGPWHEMYQQLVAAGRVRDCQKTDGQDAVGDLLYGTVLANHFTGRQISVEAQAKSIVELVFLGVLTDAERARFQATGQRC